jgi:hypothetical protein
MRRRGSGPALHQISACVLLACPPPQRRQPPTRQLLYAFDHVTRPSAQTARNEQPIRSSRFVFVASALAIAGSFACAQPVSQRDQTLTGPAAYGDWRQDRPALRRKITADDMPGPMATASANSFPLVVKQPRLPKCRLDSRLSCSRPAWPGRASCGPRRTAISSSPRVTGIV